MACAAAHVNAAGLLAAVEAPIAVDDTFTRQGLIFAKLAKPFTRSRNLIHEVVDAFHEVNNAYHEVVDAYREVGNAFQEDSDALIDVRDALLAPEVPFVTVAESVDDLANAARDGR